MRFLARYQLTDRKFRAKYNMKLEEFETGEMVRRIISHSRWKAIIRIRFWQWMESIALNDNWLSSVASDERRRIREGSSLFGDLVGFC